jgi:hypothetical protein
VIEFLAIAWPGLLTLAGFVALIIHAVRAHRRRHPRGRWRIRHEGVTITAAWGWDAHRFSPYGVAPMTCDGCDQTDVVGPTDDGRALLCQGCLHEQGRVLASERDDLIAQGVDPRELRIPLRPDPGSPGR